MTGGSPAIESSDGPSVDSVGSGSMDRMAEDAWAELADQFADGAYATAKGQVRTYVLHRQLLDHLPQPPAAVLDVGGGAGNQSFLLARLGYEVTVLDPSAAMLAKAEQRSRRTRARAAARTADRRCRRAGG